MRLPVRTIAALLLPGALLLGCSDDSGDSDGATKSPGANPSDVFATYLDALAGGDYEAACSHMTQDYQAQTVAEWQATVEDSTSATTCAEASAEGVEMLRAFAAFGEGDDAISEEALWEHEVISLTEDGDTATMIYAMPAWGEGDSTYVFTKVDGVWLISGDGEEYVESPTGDADTDVIEGAVGEELLVGDWTLTVSEINADADDELAEATDENPAAEQGYLMLTFDATYGGADEEGDIGTVIWSLTDASGEVHDAVWAIYTPGEVEGWPTTAAPGDLLARQVVFDLDPERVAGGTLRVETIDGAGQAHAAELPL